MKFKLKIPGEVRSHNHEHLRNFSVGFGIPNKMYWQQHGAQFEKRNEAKTPDIIIQRKIRSNLMEKITLKEQNVYCIIIYVFIIDSQHKSIRTFRSGGTYVRWYTIISLLWLHACHFIILKRFFFIQKLGCPYTEGVDDSWITEMIYKPGEPRIKLLQWLFSKCVKKWKKLESV